MFQIYKVCNMTKGPQLINSRLGNINLLREDGEN